MNPSLEEALQPSREKTNFMKLTRLLICGGTHALKELFDSKIAPEDLANKLNDPSVLNTLEDLRRRRILTQPQWDLLYASSGSAESKSFDISLLFKLLRELCGLTAPATGWDNLPNTTDITLEADLARIKYYRNEIYGHVAKMELNDDDFQTFWKDVKDALLRIFDVTDPASTEEREKAINNCFTGPLIEDYKKDLQELKLWYLEEMVSVNTTRLEEFDKQIRELRASLQSRETRIFPEITVSAVVKLASTGVWLFGSAYILNRYKDDPEKFLKMVNGFVLPTGALVFYINKGSIKLQIQVQTLNSLEEIWSRYQTGQLRQDLEKVLITEDLKNQAPDGDVVELEIKLSEEEYKQARARFTGLHPSGDSSHDDFHSRYDKDDPAKSTKVKSEDLSETLEPKSPTLKIIQSTKVKSEDFSETLEPKSPTLKIIHGKHFKDGESTFQVHLAFITSQDQADQAMENLEKNSDIADATYKIRACRIFNENRKSYIEECDDYGELKAGARLLRLLEMTDARNVVVILTCWHRGDLLKPVGSLINEPTLGLLRSSGLFKIKTPSKEKQVLKEVEEYFEFIRKHVPKRVSINPKSEHPKIQIFHGKTIKDRQSSFQAHLARITTRDQVEQVMGELKKDSGVAKASYNVYAYRINDGQNLCIEGFDDDDENLAGEILLHLLQITEVRNVIVIVTRWHGRVALGRTRFKYINLSALELLQSVGLVKRSPDEQEKLMKTQEDHLEYIKQLKKPVQSPTVVPKIKVAHGEKVSDRKSTFQAHLVVISSRDQVDQVLKELKKDKEIVNASYNIQAYRIYEAERQTTIQDCDDDGEFLAGASLLHLMEMLDARNVMVIVTRWHGGIPLGRDRFKHVHQCALNLLQSEGVVERLTAGQELEVLAKLDEYFEYAKENAVDYYTEIPKSSCPKIIHGACFQDRKSTFQAHLAPVTSREQVDQVLAELKNDRLVAKATYNILAYRIFDEEKQSYIEGFDDDGEFDAGERLLHLLGKEDAKNMVAVVTRWHGGILLGSARFQHIDKCVSDLLDISRLVH